MNPQKCFLLFLIIFIPVTIFAQIDYSISVLSLAKSAYKQYPATIDKEKGAREQILKDLAILYGKPGNPIDTEDVKKIITTDTLPNLPILSILNERNYNIYLPSNEIAVNSKNRGSISSIINILSELIIGKSSNAAKSVLFSALLGSILKDEEVRILFPNSAKFFETFELSKIKASPRIFTETFKSDLKGLPFNVPQIFEKVKKYKDVIDLNPKLKLYLEAKRYYKELKHLKPVYKINEEIIRNLKGEDNTHSEVINSLQLFQYIYYQLNEDANQESSVAYPNSGYTYTYYKNFSEEVDNLVKNPILLNLFLGYVCAQSPPIQFALYEKNDTLRSRGKDAGSTPIMPITPLLIDIKKNDINSNAVTEYLKNYAEKYDFLNVILDSINTYPLNNFTEFGEKMPAPDELKDLFFDKSIELLEYSMNPSNLYPDGNFDKIETKHFLGIIKKYRALEKNINEGQNFAALMNSFYIYGDLCKTHKTLGILFENFSGDFLQDISIMADLFSATSDEDIAKIADDFLFSNTDANVKKESDFTVLLNSYGGIYYGKQLEHVTNNWTRNRGPFAPIGLEISRGFKNFGSLSLFVPIFDLGAIIDFKLSNDSAETVTNFELDNIISPGAYLTYGFPSIPLSIGGGFQFSPHLGKVTLNGNVIEPRKLRWNLFLAFDLPLIKIFGF